MRPRPRVYAITFRNKILGAYFGTLALARLVTTIVSAFLEPPTFVELLPVPIDAFNMCATAVDLRLMLVPRSLGTAFGTSTRWPGSSREIRLLTSEYT